MAKNKIFFLTLLCAVFLPVFSCLPAGRVFAATGKVERIFYYADYKKAQGLQSVINNADKIDILAPQSYTVFSNLKVSGKLDLDLKKVIQEHKLKVMPLVVNAGFNQSVMHKLLTAPVAAQDKVIKFLVNEAIAKKYIGWQFDFENISYMDRDIYTAFIKRTALAFRKKKLVLSVAAIVRTNDDTTTDAYKNWSGAFDYEKIASAADFISLMAYDDPESQGPTASVPFVKAVLDYMKDKIPAGKLSLGVPLYYWGWSVNPPKRVVAGGSTASLLSVMQRFPYHTGFDEELGVSWIDYISSNSKEYKIWYEDNISFSLKLGLVKNNDLRGFSAWVLGSENPGIWLLL